MGDGIITLNAFASMGIRARMWQVCCRCTHGRSPNELCGTARIAQMPPPPTTMYPSRCCAYRNVEPSRCSPYLQNAIKKQGALRLPRALKVCVENTMPV